MSSVEDKIVAMKFDNRQFEPAAKTTLSTLDRLKQALGFKGGSGGLDQLQSAANRFSLHGVEGGITGVSKKFAALATVGVAALATITSKAVSAGLNLAKSFTLKPITDGFHEYETQMTAVQTILANTQASGATLKDVNGALSELNTYSDKTIYNFSEMAKNIGTFTAAGVDLKTSTESIKGIANLAALSGSNSEQASTAMYQLSQAISSGRVGLQDWNSVVNAGMGGTVFQRALAQTAENMGTLDKGAVKLTGKMKNATINGKSFRESITAKPGEKSWLTSAVLTSTLKQFTGDMTDAQLKQMGFKDDAIKAIQAQAKTAQNAATQVKTLSQLIGTLQEAAGSGWTNSFQILFGDFDEAKTLFTSLSNVLGGYISKSAKGRNEMLQTWKDLGGRTALLQALQNLFKGIVAVIKPIAQGFRDIFPATTGKQLYAMTIAFLNFTKGLKVGKGQIDEIRRTAAGFFAIFDIGIQVIKGVFGVLGDLFKLIFKGSGSWLTTSASVGDFLVNLDKTIKKGDLVNKFFKTLEGYLGVAKDFVVGLGKAFLGLFDGISSDDISAIGGAFGILGTRLSGLVDLPAKVGAAWGKLKSVFGKVADFLAPAINGIKNLFAGIGSDLKESFKDVKFNDVADVLNVGLLGAIALGIKKFFSGGLKLDFGNGLFAGVKDSFEQLTGTLKALQTQVQAKTLLLIAGAVALLTASIVALSLIDSKKLTSSLTAITVGFGQLLGAMAILTKVTSSAGFIKIPFIAGSMILMATAILILAAAAKVFSTMNWEEIAKGLTGVGVSLGLLVLASKGLEKSSGGMLRVGLAMIPLAVGILILSKAVQSFGSMDWGTLAKGMAGLAASLLIIAGAMQLMPKDLAVKAVGIAILGVALQAIAGFIAALGGMSWESIAKGLVGLAGSLIIFAVALSAMSGTIAGSAGLLVAAVAMRVLTPALVAFGEMSWEDIAKAMVTLFGALLLLAAGMYAMAGSLPGAAGLLVAAAAIAVLTPALQAFGQLTWEAIAKALVTLAGALLIMAGGLTLMAGSIPGSVALTIAAAALALLVPVLIALGAMSWGSIIKGLVGIAGVFAVLGVAGLLLLPIIPAILGLSAALLVLGAAMVLIGAGALLLATAFGIFAAAGASGIKTLEGLIGLIPKFLSAFAKGIIGFATTLASNATVFVGAFSKLILALLDAVIKIAPRIGAAVTAILKTILKIVKDNAPGLASAGIGLMQALLNAIKSKIGALTTTAGDIIVRFLQSMNKQVPRIIKTGTDLIVTLMDALGKSQQRLIDKGAKMIIAFINGVARTIRSNSGALGAAGGNVGSAIIEGMGRGILGGVGSLVGHAVSAAKQALQAAKNALGIHSPSRKFFEVGKFMMQGWGNGIDAYRNTVSSKTANVGSNLIKSVQTAFKKMQDPGQFLAYVPVVKPVLDLGSLNQGIADWEKKIGKVTAAPTASYNAAASISADSMTNAQLIAANRANPESDDTPSKIEFNQYNTSPKALTSIDIYRNTRSQIGQLKGALKK